MYRIFVAILSAMLFAATTSAQSKFSLGADFVSSYMWRGVAVAGTSIQPSMNFTTGGFSIAAWGSVDITGSGYKEVDLSLAYSINGFSIGLSDNWWSGEGAFDYFNFKKDLCSHYLEVNLGYEFDFGLHLAWNTIIAGAGDKYTEFTDDVGKPKRAFSSYFETGYSFSIQDVKLTAALGFTPWNSTVMYTGTYPHATDGFAVNNISLKASKDIAVTDKFSLPVFGQLAFNPATEDAFLIFGISF